MLTILQTMQVLHQHWWWRSTMTQHSPLKLTKSPLVSILLSHVAIPAQLVTTQTLFSVFLVLKACMTLNICKRTKQLDSQPAWTLAHLATHSVHPFSLFSAHHVTLVVEPARAVEALPTSRLVSLAPKTTQSFGSKELNATHLLWDVQ